MNVLSLFDGISCGRLALERAGFTSIKYYASEINTAAITVSEHNYPDLIRLGDAQNWKDWDIDWGSIDLLIGGSPCFTEDTQVLTSFGYKSIKDVEVGDMVLTHKNRYQKVLRVGSKVANTYLLKSQGIIPTKVTNNHPYYVRRVIRNNGIRSLTSPEWVEVKDLTKNCFLGIPINKESKNPFNISKDEAYVLGRYIADGHTRKDYRKSEGRKNSRYYHLTLSIGDQKINKFHSNLRFTSYAHTKSTYRCVFYNKRLVELAESFCGCGAINKEFSPVLLDLPVDILKCIVEGFLEGDGCFTNGVFKVTTISKRLALSLSIAIAKVYNVHSNVEYTNRPQKTIIEGRVVNQNPTYTVYFNKEYKKGSNAIVTDDFIWLPFKKVLKLDKDVVYNLEVEEDNSYTANNAVVHNCQGFSFAGKQLNFNDPRSKLFFVYLDILSHIKSLNPNVRFLLENVKMKREYQDIISKSLGVEPVMINSSLVSAQNRKRNYWANWNIGQPQDKGILLSDIVLDGIVEKDKAYCLTCRSGNARDYFKKHQSNIAFVPSSLGEYGIENGKINIVFKKSPDQSVYSFDVNIPDGRYDIRPLSPVECERLQTLPDHYTSCVGVTERYNQLGNGWNVDTITHILRELKSQKQS